MNKRTNKKLFFWMFLIISIFVNFSFVSSYTQTNVYSSQYNNVMGIISSSGGQSLQLDESMCRQGSDFIIQISPLSCEPTVVTSDLLEEENVNVFCKMTAIQINPLVDVTAIDAISFTEEYPREVLNIGYMPAQAALGRVQGGSQGSNLQGSLLLNNLGYVVITLRKQPNESALTNCKKTALGTQMCWVEGNLTATLKYDVKNSFGVGSALFYLPVTDDDEWESDYLRYAFWDGRGYLRALSVDDNSATLAIYSDSHITSSVLSGQRTYNLARYSSNIELPVGQTSNKIFLPGLSPCLGSLELKLVDVEDPDTRVQLRVNEDYVEVKDGEWFLDNKCQVKSISPSGLKQDVQIRCKTDSGQKTYPFSISPKVDLEVDGTVDSYELGQRLYQSGSEKKYVYLGYVGTYSESSTIENPEDSYVYLVALPGEPREKLTDAELLSVSNYVNNIVAKAGKEADVSTFKNVMKTFFLEDFVWLGKWAIKGEEFGIIAYKDNSITPFKGHNVVLTGFSVTDTINALNTDEQYSEYYQSSVDDFDKDINTYPGEVEYEDSIQTFGEKAFIEEINLAWSTGQKKTVLDLCKKFAQDYRNSWESLNLCRDILGLSDSENSVKDVTINNVIKRIAFDGISQPSLNDYSAKITVQGFGKTDTYQLRKNTPIRLTGFRDTASTTESITLEEFDANTAKIKLNLVQCDAKGSTKTDLVTFGSLSQTYCGYTFSVKEITSNTVKITVQGPNKKTASYELTKDTPVQLIGLRETADTESITLEGLDTDTATIKFNLAQCDTHAGTKTDSVTFTEGGTPQPFCGYTFSVTEIKLNKVAKVSIIPNVDFARSNSSFNFKIGVEKRAIQLSPEKAKQKIIELNKTIESWEKASKYLNKVVEGMRLACILTDGYLTVKNMKDGNSLARQEVMSGTGGWNDWCKKEMKDHPTEYQSLNACFLENSDKIEKDVNTMTAIMKSQNSLINTLGGSTDSNNPTFMSKFSANVGNTLTSLSSSNSITKSLTEDESKKLSESIASAKEVLSSGKTTELLISKGAYTAEDLKDIQLYASYLLSSSRSGSLDKTTIARLEAAIADVTVTSQGYIQTVTTANKLNIDPSRIISVNVEEKTKEIIYTGSTIGSDGSVLKYLSMDANTPIAVLQTDVVDKNNNKDYFLILDNTLGTSNYHILIKGDKLQIYDVNGKLVEEQPVIDKLKIFVFKKVDASDYSNQYISSYGDAVPLVIYFDSPYQRLPAVVPLDFKEGWYAGVENPATSYDSSGVVRQFWICNVGKDGIESFQVTTPSFGGDNCHLIVLSETGTAGSVPTRIIDLAKNAINDVENKYKAGITKVYINNLVTSSKYKIKEVKVGTPVSQTSSKECTDLWPVDDCVTLFNVCDPVICPSSRCNLGGKYYVKNVVQSGIIGSIALCYPNAKWKGGDIYFPFCLSGLNAGVEGWISVKKAYADCLQKQIDTGETVGICDERNSIYLCEFFWKQSLPFIKYVFRGVVDKIDAQGSKGGGEYQTFAASLKNAKDSFNYFTQYYAANSYKIFQVRSTETVGAEACGSFISWVYPDEGSFLDNLLSPDSPYQFIGKFEETVQTTATNPPISKYNVWYHIYAGKDTGAYYSVYLRGSGSSYYQDTANPRMVYSGYIPKGEYADEKKDFTAPSGYATLCINVNGYEECGFKEVSTSFAVNYVSDLYLKDQATTNVTTQKECISGTASIYSLLDLNIQSAAENLLNPELFTQGIIRTCSSQNPGVGTEEAKWSKVGYCDDKTIGCWIDTQSVKNAIKALNLEEEALDSITNISKEYLSANYLTAVQFEEKKKEIKAAETDSLKKIDIINAILNADSALYNNQKAYLYLERGKALAKLAVDAYGVYIANKKVKEEAVAKAEEAAAILAETGCNDSLMGDKIFSIAKSKIGTDTTRVENGGIVYDHVCATFVSNVLIEAGALSQFNTCSVESIPYRDAIVELINLFKQDGYTEIGEANWDSGLKAGDIIIWGGSGDYDKEYQHITIFSNYDGAGVTIVHDPGQGENKKVNSKTYPNPRGSNWYITHVWRPKCSTTSGTFTIGTGEEDTTLSQYIEKTFVIQDTGALNLITRNIYFKYENGGWKWSMESLYNWEDTSTTKVTGGEYDGKSPHEKTLEVINSLNNLKSNVFEEGKSIIKSAGGKTQNGFDIYLEGEAAITNAAGINIIAEEEDIFVIQEDISGFFTLGSKMQNIYYTYDGTEWKWSMESISHWEDTSVIKVTSGEYKGKSPKEVNLGVIEKLSNLKSNVFEGGKAIIKEAGGTTMNGFDIPISSSPPSTFGSNFVTRDVNKLTSLMNLLSNSKTSIIDRKCLCGTNCDDYASWIVDASTTYTIPDELILLAIMIQESSCSLTAESSGGDMGLMQINPDNCVGQYGLSSNKDTCKSLLLTNGETNINVGAQILKGAYISSSKTYDCGGVVKTYTGWEAALRGYNGWGNKTTGSCGVVTYVGDVEKKYARLVSLYG